MTKVTYHDRESAAPVVTFHAVRFEHGEPVDVPDDWSGLAAVRSHPFFSVDNGHAHPARDADRDVPTAAGEETGAVRHGEENGHSPQRPIAIGEARQRGREAHASGRHRKAPTHFSAAQKKAWLEGFDRARRKARQ